MERVLATFYTGKTQMHPYEMDDLLAIQLSGFMICAGYLKCLAEQHQQGRPLTQEEMQSLRFEGEKEVMDLYQEFAGTFSEKQP